MITDGRRVCEVDEHRQDPRHDQRADECHQVAPADNMTRGRASKVAAGGARTDERRAVMPWGHRTRIRRTWPDSLQSTSPAATGYVSSSTLSLTATCRGRGGTWNWLKPSPRKPRDGR